MNAIAPIEAPSILNSMAVHYGMDKRAFEATLRATVMPKDASNEQAAAFLLVAKEHGLNPFTREIFAFPARGGGIQPVVSVDGWMKLLNTNPQFDGMEFYDHWNEDGSDLVSITCKMFRKDRSHAVEVTEYMSECRRDTETWKRWPARMLRHKVTIQAARYAFGFAGVMEPDEFERMEEVAVTTEPSRDHVKTGALAGVWESMDEPTKEKLRKIAATVREYMDAEDPKGMVEYFDQETAQMGIEEKAALWTRLPSNVRTAFSTTRKTIEQLEGKTA